MRGVVAGTMVFTCAICGERDLEEYKGASWQEKRLAFVRMREAGWSNRYDARRRRREDLCPKCSRAIRDCEWPSPLNRREEEG